MFGSGYLFQYPFSVEFVFLRPIDSSSGKAKEVFNLTLFFVTVPCSVLCYFYGLCFIHLHFLFGHHFYLLIQVIRKRRRFCSVSTAQNME